MMKFHNDLKLSSANLKQNDERPKTLILVAFHTHTKRDQTGFHEFFFPHYV